VRLLALGDRNPDFLALATAFQPQVGSSQSGQLHPILSAWLLQAAAAGRPIRPGRWRLLTGGGR